MKVNEVEVVSTRSLSESIAKNNNTGFLTEDLVRIVQAEQANNWTQGQGKDETFMKCELYFATKAVRVDPFPAIRKKFRSFMEIKRQNPMAQFGSSDKTFEPDSVFGRKIPGLRHAHITYDLSIVYRVVGKQVYLYGFFTHDDMGTGQPNNTNRKLSAISRFQSQTFKENSVAQKS